MEAVGAYPTLWIIDRNGRIEIESRQNDLRTPIVLRCVHDYEAGKRQSDALLTGMLPLQQNVHRILATADLV